MKCFKPIFVDNPDYGTPLDFYGFPKISVPCGHCEACVMSRCSEWRVRLEEEFRVSSSACFITLTYNDDSLHFGVSTSDFGEREYFPVVCKKDIQDFLKRVRKAFGSSSLSPIRYYLVSEYGPHTLRPHYHGIFFNLPIPVDKNSREYYDFVEKIAKLWSNGFVRVDSVNFHRIAYVTKYVSCKTDLPERYDSYPPFCLMSRRPGIGHTYFDRYELVSWHRSNLACYCPNGEYKLRMPRYYRDRIFDDDMKSSIREISALECRIHNNELEHDAVKAGFVRFDPILHRWCGDVNRYVLSQQNSVKRKFDKKYKKNRKDI